MQPYLRKLLARSRPAGLASCTLLVQSWEQQTNAAFPSMSPPGIDWEEDAKVRSPFEIKHSVDDIGCYADSTLAGSRIDSYLAELGASITVVTRQQKPATASIALNDVFLCEANIEGTGNYSLFSFNDQDRSNMATSALRPPQTVCAGSAVWTGHVTSFIACPVSVSTSKTPTRTRLTAAPTRCSSARVARSGSSTSLHQMPRMFRITDPRE